VFGDFERRWRFLRTRPGPTSALIPRLGRRWVLQLSEQVTAPLPGTHAVLQGCPALTTLVVAVDLYPNGEPQLGEQDVNLDVYGDAFWREAARCWRRSRWWTRQTTAGTRLRPSRR
jgi:hypothetical protein